MALGGQPQTLLDQKNLLTKVVGYALLVEIISLPNGLTFIEVAIARLVEQRVFTLFEAGSNPVIALNFFNFSNGRNSCFVNPSQVAKFRASVVLNYSCYVLLG